ncbi:MAG: branched-chain amino acid transport system II carrier protein [Proteobacteria bacterium]|nr:branched-chain amino acid transport system II carrier protein [Pseudomonadota bacterium]
MKIPSLAVAWSTGIAIFSMFFGSGNVVFPLLLGQMAGEQLPWALIGLIITAVGAPLLGLLGSVLFEGDCKQFFYRIGAIPGYLAVLLILLLLGPIGVMPRCFIVAYGATVPYIPGLSLPVFSMIAGLITLILIARRNFILPILGFVLSPMLILTLIVIIVVSIFTPGALPITHHGPGVAMLEGLAVGYDTMDLLASIFFSVSIWMLLKEKLNITKESEVKNKVVPTYVIASLIGGGLLGVIYIGLCYSAALHHQAIAGAVPEQVLAVLAQHLLGSKLALIANIGIALACITTVMSLAVAVVDVIHVEIMNTSLGAKIPYSYGWMMFITIALTALFSTIGFTAIMAFLHPIMEICYPAIIVLTICNILYKLFGFPYVKLPVYSTILIMLVLKVMYL